MKPEETEELVELILGAFPSLTSSRAKVMAYHTILEDFSIEECVEAFKRVSRRGGKFPVSANEIYQEVMELQRQARVDLENQKILERRKMFQKEELSEEERQERARKFREAVSQKLGLH